MSPEARDWLPRFLTHLSTERRLSPHTDSNYRRDLELFVAYCDKQGVDEWPRVDSQHVRTFAARNFAAVNRRARFSAACPRCAASSTFCCAST